MARSVELAMAYVEAGAGMLELGVPFSDPIADGPTIQRASQRALGAGATLRKCLDSAAQVRAATDIPLVLMGYANPFLQRGYSLLASEVQKAGIDGLIVPDMLPEASRELAKSCRDADIDLVPLVAPTSPRDRIAHISSGTTGFLYCVSLTGVTGRRNDLQMDLPAFLQRVRAVTSLPRAVGFGVSTPAHVRSLCGQAEAAIMASALIDAFDASPDSTATNRAATIVRDMVDAATCE